MNNPTENLNAWQKKRSQMPVDPAPAAAWATMHTVLDKQLPVIKATGAAGSAGAAGLKALSIVIVTISAVVTAYYFTQLYKVKGQHINKVNNHRVYKTRQANKLAIDKRDTLKSDKESASTVNVNQQVAGNDSISNGNVAIAAAGIKNNGRGQLMPNKKTGSALSGSTGKSSAVISDNKGENSKSPFKSGRKQVNAGKSYFLAIKKGNTRKGVSNGISTHGYNANLNHQVTGKQASLNSSSKPINTKSTGDKSITPDNPDKKSIITSSKDSTSIRQVKMSNKAAIAADSKKLNTSQKVKKTNVSKITTLSDADFDFGLLTGVNSSGSFTSKNSNANFYGSLPVDIYIGAFLSYNLNDKFGVNIQVKALEPQRISGSYNHSNGSKIDSSKTVKVSDTRKAYFVSVPVHGMYRLFNNLSIKAGPEINIPVKQVGGATMLLPANLKGDSAYYSTVNNQLKSTRYQQKINFGWSAGLSATYKHLFFEADYKKSFNGYNVTSGFGSYKANSGSVQVTIGISLKTAKSK